MNKAIRHDADFLRAIIEDGLTKLPSLALPLQPQDALPKNDEEMQVFQNVAEQMSELDQFLEPNLKKHHAASNSEAQKTTQHTVLSHLSSETEMSHSRVETPRKTPVEISETNSLLGIANAANKKAIPPDLSMQMNKVQDTKTKVDKVQKTKGKGIKQPKNSSQNIDSKVSVSKCQRLGLDNNLDKTIHQSSSQASPSKKVFTSELPSLKKEEIKNKVVKRLSDFSSEQQTSRPLSDFQILQKLESHKSKTHKPAFQSNRCNRKTKPESRGTNGGVNIGRVNITVQAKTEAVKPSLPIMRKTSASHKASRAVDHAKRSYLNRF